MTINLKADMHSVHSRLSQKEQDDQFINDCKQMVPQIIYLSPADTKFLLDTLENPPEPIPALIALMHGEDYIRPDIRPHKYEAEKTSGIGFCKICYCDNMDNPIHIK